MLTDAEVPRKTWYSVFFVYIICHLLYQLADVENLENTIIKNLTTRIHDNLSERSPNFCSLKQFL